MTQPPKLSDHAGFDVGLLVGNEQIDIHLHLRPQSRAGRTRSIRTIEREDARRKLFNTRAVNRTRITLAEQVVAADDLGLLTVIFLLDFGGLIRFFSTTS